MNPQQDLYYLGSGRSLTDEQVRLINLYLNGEAKIVPLITE